MPVTIFLPAAYSSLRGKEMTGTFVPVTLFLSAGCFSLKGKGVTGTFVPVTFLVYFTVKCISSLTAFVPEAASFTLYSPAGRAFDGE